MSEVGAEIDQMVQVNKETWVMVSEIVRVDWHHGRKGARVFTRGYVDYDDGYSCEGERYEVLWQAMQGRLYAPPPVEKQPDAD